MHFVRRFSTGQRALLCETGKWFSRSKTRLSDDVVGCGKSGLESQEKHAQQDHPASLLHGRKFHTRMNSERKTSPEKTAHVGPGESSANHQAHAPMYSSCIKTGRHSLMHGTRQQLQRRYYTPRSITQQAIDVQVEHATNNPNLQTSTSDNHHSHSSFHLPVLRDYKSTRRQLLHRPLGGIEKMYNMYTSQGTDIICLMTKVETIYPVTPPAVRKALHLLHERHPLLRMSIKESQNGGSLDFVENEKDTCDFRVSDRTDWLQFILEELEHPFNGTSQSLMRYRMLNSRTILKADEESSYTAKEANASGATENAIDVLEEYSENDFSYQATFLFIMHHSIMDGGYSLWMFQEFINFLDAVSMDIDISGVKPLPLFPPFEDIFTFTSDRNQAIDKDCNNNTLSFCHSSNNDCVLQAYNKAFHHEINIPSNERLGNGCLTFKFSRLKTQMFVRTTKSQNCTVKGAVTAACTFALLELVYESKFMEIFKTFTLPIEFMADFRRIGEIKVPNDCVPHYPGVAALHIPLLASIQLDGTKITGETFWKIAEQFGESLDKNIDSPEVYEWIKAEAAKYNKFPVEPEEPGKSPYVLSISNMGKIDGVLHADVSDRVRLTDLHGHSNILVDDMPLFCITTFALNGHFCGNVSFCTNYTSYQTAAKYIGLVEKYLCSYSKL